MILWITIRESDEQLELFAVLPEGLEPLQC